jgi:hypothetical protein
VEVIDTWEMTVTDLGIFSGNFRVPLPGKEYMAIRLRKVWQKGRQHTPLVALFKIRGPKQRASDCGIFPDGSRKQWQGEARGTSASLLRKAPESHFTHKRGQQKSRTSQGEVRDLGAAACRCVFFPKMMRPSKRETENLDFMRVWDNPGIVNRGTFQKRCGNRWGFIHWMAAQVLVDHLSRILSEPASNPHLPLCGRCFAHNRRNNGTSLLQNLAQRSTAG